MNPLLWLRGNGWAKGIAATESGKVCLTGAVWNSEWTFEGPRATRLPHPDEVQGLYEIAMAEFGDRFANRQSFVGDVGIPNDNYNRIRALEFFNDNVDTTQEDVELILGKYYGEEEGCEAGRSL